MYAQSKILLFMVQKYTIKYYQYLQRHNINKLFLSKCRIDFLDFITYNATFSLSQLLICYHHQSHDPYLAIYEVHDKYYNHTLIGVSLCCEN